MADSKEQKIITSIIARLSLIRTTNGYQTDNGTRVYDSRSNLDQEDDLPATNVVQGQTSSTEDHPYGRRKTVHEMQIHIETYLERGSTAANARTAIADNKKAILGTGSEQDGYLDERWPVVTGTKPGLATQTREISHRIVYTDSMEIVGTEVVIGVQYMTQKFNADA